MATDALPAPNLQDAITAVESAFTALTNDQTVQSNAVANVVAQQAKLDAANAIKTQADTTVASDVTTVNGALDVLIAAATAAKIPVPGV